MVWYGIQKKMTFFKHFYFFYDFFTFFWYGKIIKSFWMESALWISDNSAFNFITQIYITLNYLL